MRNKTRRFDRASRLTGFAAAFGGAVLTLVTFTGLTGTASADPPQPMPGYRITLDMNECGVISEGVRGSCVVSLQTWMNLFDQETLVVDGVFGSATKGAVMSFERRHGW